MEQETPTPLKAFAHVIAAVDIVVFTVSEGKLKVLLLELSEDPLAGKWALPGGLVKVEESLDEAVKRHLLAKAGVKDVYLEQLAAFGEVDRDPRGRVITIAYFALVTEESVKPQTSPRYKNITWKEVQALPPMAYDHQEVIKVALTRLQSKVSYTNIVYSLLPEEFTLSQLQRLYEIILGRVLDKRNFRKKILSLKLLKDLEKKTSGKASRPAEVYAFAKKTPEVIEML